MVILFVVHCYCNVLCFVIVQFSLWPLLFVVSCIAHIIIPTIVYCCLDHCALSFIQCMNFFFIVNNIVPSLEYSCNWRSEFPTVPPGKHTGLCTQPVITHTHTRARAHTHARTHTHTHTHTHTRKCACWMQSSACCMPGHVSWMPGSACAVP